MLYSCIGILALIIHFIINHDALGRKKTKNGKDEETPKVEKRYRYFLLSAVCYYVTDVAWGILYEYHHIDALFPLVYSATVFYFIFMFLTMLTWIRYVVEYLNKRGLKSKAILYAVWAMFTLAIIYLMVNRFYHFIFSFNEKHEYITEPGRYIAFILQIAFYMIVAIYMLYIAVRTHGEEKVRYAAVGFTCLGFEIFLVLQILYPVWPFYAMGLIIGNCVIHSFVEAGERKEKEFFDNIAKSMAEDYEAIYYIDIETGEYKEYSKSEMYGALNVPMKGKDFYSETRENAVLYAHPDDREFAQSLYYKEIMQKKLEERKSYFYKYRIMINGEARYFRFTVMRAEDDRHMVLSVKDIDDEVTAENMNLETKKQSITFNRIAESLASNYDAIYYVNVEDSSYISYQTNNIYGQLEIRQSGDDFFDECAKNIPHIIHKSDADSVLDFIDKDNMISALSNRKVYTMEYRIVVNDKARYTRMSVRKTSDGTHFLVGVEDIDADVKKEKQVLKALNTEKELARRDELTGTKNKNAYKELEKSVQSNIDNGMDYFPFALVVCDANDLKKVNDTEGHVAGDEYIKASAGILCEIFNHSPVFRVGGDEFVVFIRGNDYNNRDKLMEKLRQTSVENRDNNSGPVLASGIAVYEPSADNLVSDIFDRADKEMYEDKQRLKGL